MPSRTITTLSYFTGALLALYLVLVVATVSFAAWQTELAHSVRETEIAIGELETQYYKAIGRINDMNPLEAGFVAPSRIGYVVDSGPVGLSRANR
ncbi:hypothetical protein KKH15_00380 [Patescibacteria group bacterium]|nr:hypothetical protein [Patescibacteria group bacterium]MBU1754986.1 hypothetical protein [Patescibacteria group bacterium]